MFDLSEVMDVTVKIVETDEDVLVELPVEILRDTINPMSPSGISKEMSVATYLDLVNKGKISLVGGGECINQINTLPLSINEFVDYMTFE